MVPDHELVEVMVGKIREVAHVERIILFGSAAEGKMIDDSDIDLLVLEPNPGYVRRESSHTRNASRNRISR